MNARKEERCLIDLLVEIGVNSWQKAGRFKVFMIAGNAE